MDNSSWRLAREVLPLLAGHVLMLCFTRSSLLDSLRRTEAAGAAAAQQLSLASTPLVSLLYKEALRSGDAMHLGGLPPDALHAMIAARLQVIAITLIS